MRVFKMVWSSNRHSSMWKSESFVTIQVICGCILFQLFCFIEVMNNMNCQSDEFVAFYINLDCTFSNSMKTTVTFEVAVLKAAIKELNFVERRVPTYGIIFNIGCNCLKRNVTICLSSAVSIDWLHQKFIQNALPP